jgi:hypothetical protein
MTKWETRKQLSYSRLGTGIFQENGGLSQVLRRVKPHTCMIDINNSVILTKGGGATKHDKSGNSSSQIVLTICNSRPSCMICENAKLWRIQRKNVTKSDKKWTLIIPNYENTVYVVLSVFLIFHISLKQQLKRD